MPTYHIKTLDDLQTFARGLVAKLKGGDVVALAGPLGVGKTALVQFVAKELGIRASVRSPSFNVLKAYPVRPAARGISQLCHIDLYRLNKKAWERLGFEEYLGEPQTVCFVEWAEKMQAALPRSAVWVRMRQGSGASRMLSVDKAQ